MGQNPLDFFLIEPVQPFLLVLAMLEGILEQEIIAPVANNDLFKVL